MPKFRKKPVVIEAVQWFKEGDHPKVVFAKSGGGQSYLSDQWVIETLEGYHVVTLGDWIITEDTGEQYPCKPDIFEKIYEPETETIDIYKLHDEMTGSLFPAFSNQDERFLSLALCGEAGELANMIKKRWRDGVGLVAEIRDELADIRVYLELLAKRFGVEGTKLDQQVQSKLKKVIAKLRGKTDGI